MNLPHSTFCADLGCKQEDAVVGEITAITETRRGHGHRRVTAEIRNRGMVVNSRKVRRIMRENGLNPKRKRRCVQTTDSDHDSAIYPNVAKDCEVHGPDQLWVGDITYIAIATGFAYLAVILDAWSRKIVGNALGRNVDVRLTTGALDDAIEVRRPLPGCVFHSDRGTQYAAAPHRRRLKRHGSFGSMSRRGNPYARPLAMMEAPWGVCVSSASIGTGQHHGGPLKCVPETADTNATIEHIWHSNYFEQKVSSSGLVASYIRGWNLAAPAPAAACFGLHGYCRDTSRHDSPQIQHTLFAGDSPIVCQIAARAFKIQARAEFISTRSRDRTVTASTLSLFAASFEEVIPAVFRAAGTAPAKRGIQRVDDAIAPTATCIAVNSRASTASCCGQTSGTALTGCGQQKVHATRKTGIPSGTVRIRRPRLHRAALHRRCCCKKHCSTIGVVSPQLAIHVGALIDQRIQVSVSPSTTVACDWHAGWAWTTCDIAASKRANAAGQLLKRPAAQFPPLPCRRLEHPAGNRLYEQPPHATSDSRALMTGVLGRSRICTLVQACNGRLGRNRKMPDEFSTLSLLAESHLCHCSPDPIRVFARHFMAFLQQVTADAVGDP